MSTPSEECSVLGGPATSDGDEGGLRVGAGYDGVFGVRRVLQQLGESSSEGDHLSSEAGAQVTCRGADRVLFPVRPND